MFEGMPGLRFKFFTFDEKNQQATNFYVWDSTEAAETGHESSTSHRDV